MAERRGRERLGRGCACHEKGHRSDLLYNAQQTLDCFCDENSVELISRFVKRTLKNLMKCFRCGILVDGVIHPISPLLACRH